MSKNAVSNEVMDVQMPLARPKGATGSKDEWDREMDAYAVDPKVQAQIDELQSRRTESKPDTLTQEQLCEQKELNAEAVRDYRFDDQDIIEDEACRRGRVMNHMEFLSTLRGGLRCWYNEVPYRGIIGLRAIKPGFEQLGPQYVCGVKLGRTTEYDTFHFDSRGLPLNRKTIGWRSVLLQLVIKGFLTEEEAHALFGHPSVNRGSTIYRKKLWQIRNKA